MKKLCESANFVGVMMVVAIAASIAVAGCGNDDSEPPKDPSYYKGPMAPKNTTPGGPQTEAGTGT